MRCDLSRLLSRKITKRIHSSKPASLNRPIHYTFLHYTPHTSSLHTTHFLTIHYTLPYYILHTLFSHYNYILPHYTTHFCQYTLHTSSLYTPHYFSLYTTHFLTIYTPYICTPPAGTKTPQGWPEREEAYTKDDTPPENDSTLRQLKPVSGTDVAPLLSTSYTGVRPESINHDCAPTTESRWLLL